MCNCGKIMINWRFWGNLCFGETPFFEDGGFNTSTLDQSPWPCHRISMWLICISMLLYRLYVRYPTHWLLAKWPVIPWYPWYHHLILWNLAIQSYHIETPSQDYTHEIPRKFPVASFNPHLLKADARGQGTLPSSIRLLFHGPHHATTHQSAPRTRSDPRVPATITMGIGTHSTHKHGDDLRDEL